MATHQPALLCDLEEHQWYVHMSRDDGADLREACEPCKHVLLVAFMGFKVGLSPFAGPPALAPGPTADFFHPPNGCRRTIAPVVGRFT